MQQRDVREVLYTGCTSTWRRMDLRLPEMHWDDLQ